MTICAFDIIQQLHKQTHTPFTDTEPAHSSNAARAVVIGILVIASKHICTNTYTHAQAVTHSHATIQCSRTRTTIDHHHLHSKYIGYTHNTKQNNAQSHSSAAVLSATIRPQHGQQYCAIECQRGHHHRQRRCFRQPIDDHAAR